MSMSPRSHFSESSDDEMFIFPLSITDVRLSSGSDSGEDRIPYSSATVKGRRRTFSQPVVDKWKRVVEKVLSLDDPWTKFHLEEYPVEHAFRHRYSAASKKWVQDSVEIKMEPSSFARGAMRECFRLKKKSKIAKESWEHCHNYVAKRYIADVDREVYFEDVRLQMDAKLWGEEFNRHNPPKKVDIFQVSVLEFTERENRPLYHLEHYIEGEYIKYNSNSGFVSEVYRKTPQAFSHFTFERSGHQLIVVDVQGVLDCYTDPQIHTSDGKGYGDGNLGTKGMALFFHSHKCNDICDSLGLSKFDLSPTERSALNRLRGVPQRKMTTVCRSAISVCISPNLTSDVESAMDFVRTRSLSTASDGDDNNVEMGSLKISPRSRFHDVTEEKEWDENGTSSMESLSGQFPGYPNNSPIQYTAPHRRHRRTTDSVDSITCSKEEEKLAFWDEMRKRSRPSCFQPISVNQLAELNHDKVFSYDAAYIVLGQVHLDLARYHEVGRFSVHDAQGEGEYDRSAAWFHLEMAANCGSLEAIITMGHIYLGLPHELLADFSLEQDEDHVEEGLALMQRAAELNDHNSMLLIAQAFDTGSAFGSQVEPNWLEAVKWYEKLVECLDITLLEAPGAGSVDGTAEGNNSLNFPKHTILARIAEMYRTGAFSLNKDPTRAGDLYNEAAEAAMEVMNGKMANKYYMLAEEAYGESEE